MKSLSRNSSAYPVTAQAADDHAVCLIGWEGPRPAAWGDNHGVWPVRIVVTKKEMTAADRADLETPHVRVVVLEYVMVETKAHADRLRSALDEVLLGHSEEKMNMPLKHRWRNVRGCFDEGDETSRQIWWGLVLEEAQRLLRTQRRVGERIDTYDADEAYRRLSARAAKGRV